MSRRSTGAYPPNWFKIAQQTKADAGWKCIRCGHHHEPEGGYTLTVHHLDFNPANCKWWNLVALCQRCHLQIQNKVFLQQPYMFEHSEWFKPYAAGYYAWANDQPDDKDFVLAHIDQLLDFGRPVKLFKEIDNASQ